MDEKLKLVFIIFVSLFIVFIISSQWLLSIGLILAGGVLIKMSLNLGEGKSINMSFVTLMGLLGGITGLLAVLFL